jgi:hypothetical protein
MSHTRRSASQVSTIRFVIAATIAAAIPSIHPIRNAQAQESIVMEGAAMPGMGAADCNCRGVQRPPWHGSVANEACGCGPVCQAHGMFHADPCGQLRSRHQIHSGCVVESPWFPRLHGWRVDGAMPTPPPISLPRCHECGAVIAGGY